ncbi:hypothetical protein JHK85_002405 [Glycine max]|nr:hypothetical protein JHK87_002338 [Glycine soja]KAG5070028.1 hypothetical protein JHK85_002405 [Glycine max]KHN42612.1 hypothetical protein glysoja_018855 [Glycine soja]
MFGKKLELVVLKQLQSLFSGKAKLPFGRTRKMVLMPPRVKSRFLILHSNN